MKNLTVSPPLTSGTAASRFNAARAMAVTLAEADSEMLEPELIAWVDRSTSMTSPVLEGCSWPEAWHDYGVSHDGRLEVKVGYDSSFIFAESSPFDSYEHFGHGPFINIRDAKGNEMICRTGGDDCVQLDEWTSKLT
jgi:hypothetical protein